MKKIILVIAVVLVFGGFVVFRKLGSPEPFERTVPIVAPSSTTTSLPTTGAVKYKDGSYTGSVADATYGNIQVQVVIQGGKITDINFIQSPSKPGHTTEVTDQSLPILKQEAIAAQSANVDLVSGATQTSQGFMVTLQSALDQAKIS